MAKTLAFAIVSSLPFASNALQLGGSLTTEPDQDFELKWLHIPKCGTSFGNVMITYGCTGLDANPLEHAELHQWYPDNSEKCSNINVTCIHAPVGQEDQDCKPPASGGFATMFRDPEQRLLSDWNYIEGYRWYYTNTTDFPTELPKFIEQRAGCQTRMLTGADCGSGYEVKASQASVDKAIKTLRADFAFVGLTEEWSMSVCLFHKMFGQQCNKREFQNVRPGPQRQEDGYDTSVLNGFVDEYDRQIYAAAKEIFHENLLKHKVTKESCEAECWNWVA